MSPRFPWLDDRTTLLISILNDHHHLPLTDGLEDAVRQDINDHLDFVEARGVVDLTTERRKRRP